MKEIIHEKHRRKLTLSEHIKKEADEIKQSNIRHNMEAAKAREQQRKQA